VDKPNVLDLFGHEKYMKSQVSTVEYVGVGALVFLMLYNLFYWLYSYTGLYHSQEPAKPIQKNIAINMDQGSKCWVSLLFLFGHPLVNGFFKGGEWAPAQMGI